MADESLTHVVFPLEVDENGWPPVSAERVWARQVGDNQFVLLNAPWFVQGVAEGDVVSAREPAPDQYPHFVERLRWSGNYTVRVIPFRAGPLQGDLQAVLDCFAPLGVSGEGAGPYAIVALTVPPTADIGAVKALLAAGRRDGRWDYDEGCVDDSWINR